MDRRLIHPERTAEDSPGSDAAMCSGKKCLTRDIAKTILSRDQNKGKRRVAYKCLKCNAWHIGCPPPKGLRRPKRNRRNGW